MHKKKARVIYIFVALLLITLVLVPLLIVFGPWSSNPDSNAASEPSDEGQMWLPEIEDLVASADTVVIGHVVEEFASESIAADGQAVICQDFIIQVESYVIKPLPYASLIVRVPKATCDSNGHCIGLKEPGLEEGEYVLLFLNKRECWFTLADNEFTMLGDMMGGKFIIEVTVKNAFFAFAPWESLEDVTARIKAAGAG